MKPVDSNARDLAINLTNKNILVSAGAGSGKTFTMTERVVHLVNDLGYDISSLLILTFTNMAAKEMRDRIIKRLREVGNIDQALKAQTADICTFDSFSLKVLKKYGYKLGIERHVTNADESVLGIETNKIIKSIFDRLISNDDEGLKNLLRTYPDKTYSSLTKFITTIINKASLSPNEEAYYDEYQKYYTGYFKDVLKESYKHNVLEAKKEFVIALKLLIDNLDSSNEKLSEYCVDLVGDLNSTDDLTKLTRIMSEFKYPVKLVKPSKELTNLKKETKDLGDSLLSKLEIDIDEEIKIYFNNYGYAKTIFGIAKETYYELKKFKEEHNYFTFADIAKYSIEILRNNSDVKDELKNKYKEIMIDEYQDTSDLQEAFVNMISRNNVYQCGDIKQSIYGFRNANPKLFLDKYHSYKKDDENAENVLLELTENFRSRKETIDDFNTIFQYALTNNVGGADYKRSHMMHFGQHRYDLDNSRENHHMELVSIYNDDESKAVEFNKKAEIAEAFYIASDIKKKMNERMILDLNAWDKGHSDEENKKNAIRRPRFKDFAVIARDTANFNDIKKILEFEGIPALICKSEDLSRSYVVSNLLSTLFVLFAVSNNISQTDEYKDTFKLCLVSMLRGYTIKLTDDEIFDIVVNGKTINYLEDKGLIKLANKSNEMSLSDYIDEVIEHFDIYNNVYLHSEVLKADEEIKAIKQKLSDLVMLGNTNYDAVNILMEAFKGETTVEFETEIDDSADMVRIMTIHKSKGLEFPFVYVPYMNKHFNENEKRQAFLYDEKFGLIMPVVNNHIKSKSGFKEILFDLIDEERLSEEARLLYVALTRAQDSFTLIFKESSSKVLAMNSLYTIFNNSVPKSEILSYVSDIGASSIKIDDNYVYGKTREIAFGNVELKDVINVLPNKVSHTHASGEVNEIMDDKTRKNIELGLSLHGWLEALDLANPDYSIIPNEFIKNKCKNVLSLEPYRYSSDKEYYQEYEFYNEEKNIHGIIDLFIVSKDHIDLIDYKLAHTDKESYRVQLKVYKDYLREQYPGKTINVYLLSLINEELVRVDI